MSDNNQMVSFSEALFQSIENLGIWADDRYERQDEGIFFQVSDICGQEEFGAIGHVVLEPSAEDRRAVFMNLYLMLAKDIEDEIKGDLIPKLYELNLNYRTGVFYVDEASNLCYETRFPIMWGDVEGAMMAFAAEYMDIMDFLDGMYPYILRCAVVPKDSNLQEYIWLMTQGAGEEE